MSITLLRCLTLVLWSVWIAVYWQGGRGLVRGVKETARSRKPAADTGTMLAIVLPSMVLVTTGLLNCRRRLRVWTWGETPGAVLTGTALTLLGTVGTFLSRRELGALWSPGTVLREGHRVVGSGPYRLVRHPTYAAGIAMDVGTGLVFPTWWNAVACLVVAGAFILRARYEDRFLLQHLPGYVQYRQKVRRRLLPGVW